MFKIRNLALMTLGMATYTSANDDTFLGVNGETVYRQPIEMKSATKQSFEVGVNTIYDVWIGARIHIGGNNRGGSIDLAFDTSTDMTIVNTVECKNCKNAVQYFDPKDSVTGVQLGGTKIISF